MDPCYLTRLVFDLEGQSVILLYHGSIAAGISYRIFSEERFIEIAFCAVDHCLQGSGCGRLIIQYLKSVIQSMEIYDVLTCADNNALDFFRKQGFNDREIRMDPKRWAGRTKEYQKVTLVHCPLWAQINYHRVSNDLEKMIQFTESRVAHRFLPPIFDDESEWKPYFAAPSYFNLSLPELRRILGYPKEEDRSQGYLEGMAALKVQFMRILNTLLDDPDIADVFQAPVTEEIAPGYFDSISMPMDLQTIQRRLMRYPDYYKRPAAFAADLMLMVDNCKFYNTTNSPCYLAAIRTMKQIRLLYATEFPHLPPLDG
jgi:histone acetyltransferase